MSTAVHAQLNTTVCVMVLATAAGPGPQTKTGQALTRIAAVNLEVY